MVRKGVGALLRQAGHEGIDAEYGVSGIAMAQSERPDLILLDLNMPVVDGFEVLSRLRGDPVAKRIPVIILTAKIDAASERACMELGAVDYIKKPWGPQEIEERVAMALGYPELVKGLESTPVLTTLEPENVQSDGVEDTGADDNFEEPQNLEESQELSPRRFKTREFRINTGEPDNPYLA